MTGFHTHTVDRPPREHRSRLVCRDPGSPRARRGLSLIELVVSAVLFGTVVVSVGPVLSWVRQERRLADQRQLATLELANLAERLALRPYAEVSSESLAELKLSDEAAAGLPSPVLTVTVDQESDPLPARRITLQLAWNDPAERPRAPLKLVCWRYEEVEP